MSRVTQRVVAALAIAAVLGAPSAADAARSYQGSDYSTHSLDRTRVYACDREADSHGVHADYWFYQGSSLSTSGRVDDPDGAASTCGKAESASTQMYKHRAVEEVNLAPDYYGPWKYYWETK